MTSSLASFPLPPKEICFRLYRDSLFFSVPSSTTNQFTQKPTASATGTAYNHVSWRSRLDQSTEAPSYGGCSWDNATARMQRDNGETRRDRPAWCYWQSPSRSFLVRKNPFYKQGQTCEQKRVAFWLFLSSLCAWNGLLKTRFSTVVPGVEVWVVSKGLLSEIVIEQVVRFLFLFPPLRLLSWVFCSEVCTS